MIDFTKFFSFKKPDENEFYNVALNNENLDSIDEALEAHAHDKRYYTKTENDAHLSNKAAGNPQTGAALDAEMLGGVAAEKYATTESYDWMPILRGTTVAGSFTYLQQRGNCCITGNIATISGVIEISNIAVLPIGIYQIAGIPVAPKGGMAALDIGYTRGGIDSAVSKIIIGEISNGAADLRVYYVATISGTTVATSDIVPLKIGAQSPTVIIRFSATYEIA